MAVAVVIVAIELEVGIVAVAEAGVEVTWSSPSAHLAVVTVVAAVVAVTSRIAEEIVGASGVDEVVDRLAQDFSSESSVPVMECFINWAILVNDFDDGLS